MYKNVFLRITTSGNNPLKLIPMDLEFPIIPMLMLFLNLFCIVFFLLYFLDQYWKFNLKLFLFMFVHEPFTYYIYQNHFSFIYAANRFW